MRVDDFTNQITPEALVTAAVAATVVRLLSYMYGSHDGDVLRESISKMGVTVVMLEILIVLLRFFSTFQILHLVAGTLQIRMPNVLFAMSFVFFGAFVTFLFTKIPSFLPSFPMDASQNDAVLYLEKRPFEVLPVITEYIVLFVLASRKDKQHILTNGGGALWILCMSMIMLIVAIRGTDTSVPGLAGSRPAPVPLPFPK